MLYTNTKPKNEEFFWEDNGIKKRGTFFVRFMVKLGKKENFMRLFPQDDRNELRDPEEEGTDVVIKEDPSPCLIPWKSVKMSLDKQIH